MNLAKFHDNIILNVIWWGGVIYAIEYFDQWFLNICTSFLALADEIISW